MKTIILLTLMLLSAPTAFSQVVQPSDPGNDNVAVTVRNVDKTSKIYNVNEVEQQAEFPGGMDKFRAFIASRYNMPPEDGLNGKIVITFCVEIDGSITDIKILRDLGFGTGEEAVRVVSLSPKWQPAMLNGSAVRSYFSLPIALATQN